MRPADALWAATLRSADRICVHFGRAVSKEGRILISAGTRSTRDPAYARGSFVPRRPWSEPKQDLPHLTTEHQEPPSQVGLHELPSSLIDRLRLCCDQEESAQMRRDVVEHLIDHCDQHVAKIAGRVHLIGLSESAPGGATITRNMRLPGRKKIGLHIDSWDGPAAEGRASRTQRICINIGSTERFFLFLNLPISRFAVDEALGVNAAVQSFLLANRDFPAIALRVKPGEAYIAPTELIVHDGWNPARIGLDRTFTVRADFAAL